MAMTDTSWQICHEDAGVIRATVWAITAEIYMATGRATLGHCRSHDLLLCLIDVL